MYDFNDYSIFSSDLPKTLKDMLQKILSVAAELFHIDTQTDERMQIVRFRNLYSQVNDTRLFKNNFRKTPKHIWIRCP